MQSQNEVFEDCQLLQEEEPQGTRDLAFVALLILRNVHVPDRSSILWCSICWLKIV